MLPIKNWMNFQIHLLITTEGDQYTKLRNCIDIHSAGTKPMNDQKTVCHIWKNNNNYLTNREIEKKKILK